MYKLKDKKIIFKGKFNPETLNYIGSGANAKVYNIMIDDEPYALKIYDMPREWNKKELEQLIDINIDSFIVPMRLFYANHKFKGYIMKFCKGENLKSKELDITIKEFIDSSKKLIYNTNRLSELGYLLDDISLNNLMYDKDFKVIDTDFFEQYLNVQKDNNTIKKLNNKKIIIVLVNCFIKNIELEREFNKDTKLDNLRTNCINNNISFITFVKTLCELVYKKNEYNNITLSELGSKLKEYLNIEISSYRNISF